MNLKCFYHFVAVQSLALTYRKDKKQSNWIKLSNIYLFGKTCSDLWRWHVVGHLVPPPIPRFLFCVTTNYKSHTFCKFPLHLHYYIHLYRTLRGREGALKKVMVRKLYSPCYWQVMINWYWHEQAESGDNKKKWQRHPNDPNDWPTMENWNHHNAGIK